MGELIWGVGFILLFITIEVIVDFKFVLFEFTFDLSSLSRRCPSFVFFVYD